MLNAMRNGNKFFVWIILGLLVFGLAGFGAADMVRGGLQSNVASVGDEDVSVQDFATAMTLELRNQSYQQGRAITADEVRANNLQYSVLAVLTRAAAVDAETRNLGISVGDESVAREIQNSPSFRTAMGQFSRTQFEMVLRNNNLTERDFTSDLRKSLARDTVSKMLTDGLSSSPVLAATVLGHALERRTFEFVSLPPETFGGEIAEPDDAALTAYYDANPAEFTVPETRAISYALLDPAKLAADITPDEAILKQAYDARIETFRTPERRMVDRVVFPSEEAATAAKARLDAGEATMAALAAELGQTPAQIALGEVTSESFPGEVGTAIFSVDQPGIVGPVTTSLGPALFQINVILYATERSFDEAKESLRAEYAASEAASMIAEEGVRIDDMVAGGARVEEIVAETNFEAGKLDLPVSGPTEGLAADPLFRAAAFEAQPDQETDLVSLANGSIVVIRVDAIRAAHVPPMADIRDKVLAGWTVAERAANAKAAAEALLEKVRIGGSFREAAAELGLTVSEAGPITRNDVPDGLGPELVTEVFKADLDTYVSTGTPSGPAVAKLITLTSFDPSAVENLARVNGTQETLDVSIARDFQRYYSLALEARDGVSINTGALDSVLNTIQ